MLVTQYIDGGAAARSQPQKPDVVYRQGLLVKSREPQDSHALDALTLAQAPEKKYIRHLAPKSGYLTCCRCGHNKREVEFYPSKKSKTGRRRRCVSCEKEMQAERYSKRKAKAVPVSFATWWADNAALTAGVIQEEQAKLIWLAAQAAISREKDQQIAILNRKLQHIKTLAASL